jgi:hypothetical protein
VRGSEVGEREVTERERKVRERERERERFYRASTPGGCFA